MPKEGKVKSPFELTKLVREKAGESRRALEEARRLGDKGLVAAGVAAVTILVSPAAGGGMVIEAVRKLGQQRGKLKTSRRLLEEGEADLEEAKRVLEESRRPY